MSSKRNKDGGREAGRRALFIDLEYVALDGYERVYKSVSDVLKQKGIDLSIGLFRANFLSRPLSVGIEHLLRTQGRDRLSADKLAADIREAAVAAVTDRSVSAVAGVVKAIEHCRQAGLLIGVLTRLDAAAAAQLLERLGLSDSVDVVEATGATPLSHPTSDCWLRLARSAHVTPRACIVVAAAERAARTALYASMSCIVLPSRITDFGDFGGTDAVLEKAGALTAAVDAVLERTK